MDEPIQRNGTTATNPAPSVLISGASFAGLAAAWWMNKLGYSVTVVEIAKGLRKGGTPVNIRDGVIDVVRRMNLLERIKSESLPLRPMTFLDTHGSPLPLALSQTASRAWRNPQTRWPSPSRVEDSVPFHLCSVAMEPTPL